MMDKLGDFIKARTRDEQYVIGYRKIDNNFFLYDGNYKSKFVTIRPTQRHWYADPIINKIEDKEYLFCEMYDIFSNKGAIGISYRDKEGRWSRPKRIIGGRKGDQHLSFPVVIKWKDSYYMFPCIGNGTIQVYKMGNTEREWNLWCELFDDHYYVDMVFEIEDGHLYMISCIKDIQHPQSTKLSVNEILNLDIKNGMIISPAICEGQYYEKSARNGGGLLYVKNDDGHLTKIRVTQESDEINGYGYNLQFRTFSMENAKLDESLYHRVLRDKLVTDIDKSIWFEPIGPHTYSRSADDEIIDIKVKAFSVVYILRYFYNNVKILITRAKHFNKKQ